MNLIIVLFLVLIAASMFTSASATRASRRRYRRAYQNTNYAISQERNLVRILGTNELSLFNVDQIGSDGHYNQAICGYMNEHMFINGSLVEYTDAVKSAFIKEYFATIYLRQHFPLTHRPVGEVWLNASQENVRRFHKRHCPIPMNYGGFLMGIFMIGMLFSFVMTTLSCFVFACQSFDKHMEEWTIDRARRNKVR